jgi:predicted flap endonuclease-1-like 5' DNA nuclease
MWTYFCLGLLVGWALEWLIDWAWWRRRDGYGSAAGPAERGAASAAWGAAAVGTGATLGSAPAASAPPLGVAAYAADDIEAVEGIGPKIAELLKERGIGTFARLAATPTAELQKILDDAGPRFRLADPGTWSEQAALAARGDWAGFDRLRRELVAGVRAPAPRA